jgi:hypothetical protein
MAKIAYLIVSSLVLLGNEAKSVYWIVFLKVMYWIVSKHTLSLIWFS